MSQQTVLTYLKEHKKEWFSVRQLANGLDASIGSITCNVKKLREQDAVEWKLEEDVGHWKYYFYKYKEYK